jgi:type II secretory pathway component PulK
MRYLCEKFIVMDTVQILTLSISGAALLGTIISWFVIHRLSRSRDRHNKKRDIRVGYLIDAFRQIEKASNRDEFEHQVLLESALADIQLFGSLEQIRLVKTLTDEFVNTKVFNANALLTSLRNDLRSELGLKQTDERWIFLRMTKGYDLRLKYRHPEDSATIIE